MQTASFAQLREDVVGIVAAAQENDVWIVNEGKVVAVVSKPDATVAQRPGPIDFEQYWKERERLLADVIVQGDWDSTQAISEDRDDRA